MNRDFLADPSVHPDFGVGMALEEASVLYYSCAMNGVILADPSVYPSPGSDLALTNTSILSCDILADPSVRPDSGFDMSVKTHQSFTTLVL